MNLPGKYVYLKKFADVGLTSFPSQALTAEEHGYASVANQVTQIMENNSYTYSISTSMTNGIAELKELPAKYAYIIKLENFSSSADSYIYNTISPIFAPVYDAPNGLKRDFTIYIPFEKTTNNDGLLNIVSNIGNNYNISQRPIAFVYRVNVTLNGNSVFSNIVTVNATSNGSITSTVTGIPVGSFVTVILEYCSAGFAATGEKEQYVTISNTTPANMNFNFDTQSLTCKTAVISNYAFLYDNENRTAEETQWNNDSSGIELNSEFLDSTLHNSISNDSSTPYYVRLKVLSTYPITYSDPEGMWTMSDDGYYIYYNTILDEGESSSPINALININDENIENFNVSVIVEYTPAQYDSDGNAYADWDS